MPKLIADEIRETVAPIEKSALLINEAENGAALMAPYLDALPAGSSVLEVGSGPAILLAHIATRYPALDVTGIEPFGAGFSSSEPFIATLGARYPIRLQRSGYEAFGGDETFDLIFSINVFEHLPDWRHFLRFVEGRLKPGGRCVIFCPNYGLPFESHFRLPVIGSKALTRRIFAKRIERHERNRKVEGLWGTLNFVKWSDVKRELESRPFEVRFDPDVVGYQIDRLETDPEFFKRKKGLARVARLVKRSGLLSLMRHPMFWNLHPYMHLELTRRA